MGIENLGKYAHPPKVVKIVKTTQATSAPMDTVRPLPSMNTPPPPAFAPMKRYADKPVNRASVQIPFQRAMPMMATPQVKNTVKIVRGK